MCKLISPVWSRKNSLQCQKRLPSITLTTWKRSSMERKHHVEEVCRRCYESGLNKMFIVSSAALIGMTAVYRRGIFLVGKSRKTLKRCSVDQSLKSDLGGKAENIRGRFSRTKSTSCRLASPDSSHCAEGLCYTHSTISSNTRDRETEVSCPDSCCGPSSGVWYYICAVSDEGLLSVWVSSTGRQILTLWIGVQPELPTSCVCVCSPGSYFLLL